MAAQEKLGSERAIAEALCVKRHQLRRALQALRASGELAPAEAKRKSLLSHNGENLVRTTNPMEVIEMRIAIEPFLARLAALRASPLAMAAIERAATTAVGVDSGAGDLNFHKPIAAGSGNKLAASLYDLLRRVARDARLKLNGSQPAFPNRVQQRRASRHRTGDRRTRPGGSRTRDAPASRRRPAHNRRAAQSVRPRAERDPEVGASRSTDIAPARGRAPQQADPPAAELVTAAGRGQRATGSSTNKRQILQH
jgi:hypothetical protein